jgi:hypothetical protein
LVADPVMLMQQMQPLVFSPAATPTNASATAVLTNASENAIVIRAKTTIGGTSQTGDIVKQEASRRYKVTTADGTAFCRLVADDTPAVNEGYIIATSAAGGTYYVIKLTAHRATLVAKAGRRCTRRTGSTMDI